LTKRLTPAVAKDQKNATDYLTNLPLILLLLLELEIHHFQSCSSTPTEGADELEDDLSSINTITNEVIFDVDVLPPVMEDGVLGEGDGGLIVHHQRGWVSFFPDEVAQQPLRVPRDRG
jgi:hypothetical protein